ncbi:MAG: cyclic nucleotide-binding domain-containing protein [Desulfobacterales bacterium]|nr:cyclic nucleotide-binding domain-containing protein [Desulfobacterales bacterium]
MTLYDILSKMPIFARFSDEEKRAISEIEHSIHKYRRGDQIIEEGEHSTSLYLLVKGAVLITKKIDEATIRLARLGPGEIFGEMSFFTDQPRRTSVMANDKVLVMKMDEDFFDSLEPRVKDKIKDYIISLLIERLDKMNDSIMQISRTMPF